jgi:hypothetical protein
MRVSLWEVRPNFARRTHFRLTFAPAHSMPPPVSRPGAGLLRHRLGLNRNVEHVTVGGSGYDELKTPSEHLDIVSGNGVTD